MMNTAIFLIFTSFRLISSDVHGFTGEYTIGATDTSIVASVNGRFLRILSDELLMTGAPGEPPTYYSKIMFVIPQSGGFHVDVVPVESEEWGIPVPLIPVPEFDEDGLSERYVPSSSYLEDRWFPEKYYGGMKTGVIGDLRYGEVELYPIKYNPHRNVLKIVKKFRIVVSFDELPVEVKSREDIRLLNLKRLNLVNYDIGKGWKVNARKTLNWDDPFSRAEPWVKIAVMGEGIYEIDYDDLSKLGVGPIPSDMIALYSFGGNVLPSDVDSADVGMERVGFLLFDGGDGEFGPGDRILFYGIPMQRHIWDGSEFEYFNHPYSDTNFYWLGLYSRSGDGIILTPASNSYNSRVNRCIRFYRHERELFNIAQKGLWWLGEMIQRDAGQRTASMSFQFDLTGLTDSTAEFEIQVVGGDKHQSRNVVVFLNGDSVASMSLSGLGYRKVSFNYDRFRESGNTLTLTVSPNEWDTLWHNRNDYIFLDYFEVKYAASSSYGTNNSLIYFEIPHSQVEVDVPNDAVRVWDVTDGVVPRVFEVSNGEFGGDFQAGTALYVEKDTRRPIYMKLFYPRHLREMDVGDVNYLAIVPSVFKGVFSRYARWRSEHLLMPDGNGHWGYITGTVLTVVAEDIFNEFGFGVRDPVAIRNFVKFVYDNDDSLIYMSLVGDGHYDYKGYTTTFGNFIPPYEPYYLLNIESQLGALDAFFADMNGDGYPDIYNGRIPVRYNNELQDYISKIQLYESGDATGLWRDRVLLVADDEYGENQNVGGDTQHMYYINTIYNNWIPHSMDVSHVYEIEFPRPAPRVRLGASEAFIREFNRGASMVVIFIHGHPAQLSHEKLFDLQRDAGKINAGRKNPFVFVASCKVGGFDRIKYPRSITEDWTLRPGGAIATVSSTVGEFHSTNMRLFEGMMNVLRTDSSIHPFGEMISNGITYSSGRYFVLFGDPSVPYSLLFPKFDVSLPDTLQRGRETSWSVSFTKPSSGNFVYVNALGPRKNVTYHSPDGVTVINYVRPPSPYFVGKSTLEEDSAHGFFWIPVSVDTGGNANFLIYNPTGVWGVAGNADNRTIIREHGVIVDTAGASISLIYNGKKLDNGDTLNNGIPVEIRVSDDLGINLSREVRANEPGLSLWYSLSSTPVDLTPLFEYDIDSDTSGTAYYTLNFGQDGEQTITIREYDVYENLYVKTWRFYVTAEDRLSVTSILVYPNPVYQDGNVSIGFELSIPATVRLSIWTLDGRKIWDSGKRILPSGYNEVIWDGRDMDGEMPANGLYFVTIESEANGVRKTYVSRFAIAK